MNSGHGTHFAVMVVVLGGHGQQTGWPPIPCVDQPAGHGAQPTAAP